MTSSSDKELAASARWELLEDILPFWRGRAVDEQRGGFIGQMSNDLCVQDDAPKGLILNARILWTFSAAYAYTQDEKDRTLARRAYYYNAILWDRSSRKSLRHNEIQECHFGALTPIRLRGDIFITSCVGLAYVRPRDKL